MRHSLFRPLSGMLCGLLLAAAPVAAQSPGGGFFGAQRGFYGWLRHVEGEQLGETAPFTALGANGFFLAGNGVWMLRGEGLVTNDGDPGGSLGIGRRFWAGSDTIIGASLAYDIQRSVNENEFRQTVLSLEMFRETWLVRGNAYVPVGTRIRNVMPPTITNPGQLIYSGNNIITAADILQIDETSLKGFDVEVGRHLGSPRGEVFLGLYALDGRTGDDTSGVKGGARAHVNPWLTAELTVSDDELFGTQVFGGLKWIFRGGGIPRTLEDKLTVPVERNTQVAVLPVRSGISASTVLTSQGAAVTVTHVRSGGFGGNGTVDDPYRSLIDASGTTSDIVLVGAGSIFNGEDYALAPGQMLLGEGGGFAHTIPTDQLGVIPLPAIGGAMLPRPVINGSPGPAIVLNNDTRVANLDLINPGTGLRATNIFGSVDVQDVLINGAFTGIDVVGGIGTLAFGGVDVVAPNGTAFNVNGGSADVTFDGSISKNSAGNTISVLNHSGGTLAFAGAITATDGVGLQFNNADGTYTFDGPVALGGGDAGVDILGTSNGTFNFSNTTITDPSGVAFNVNGGSASVTYGGSITKGGAGATVAVTNHSGGAMLFRDGAIDATAGTGLQFNSADGTYDFTGAVTLNGDDAGIDILGGSTGTFTFADATVLDPSGDAIAINGGSASVTFSGDVAKAGSGNLLAVTNHTGGSLTFRDGTLQASDGTGLQFNNADGSYAFDGTLLLNGGDTGVDILGSSNGTFTFADATILDPSGVAFRINGGSADVTYDGNMTKSTPGAVLEITNHTGGTFTHRSGTIDATDGTGIQFNSADGTYRFDGIVTLDGGDAGVDILGNSNGTFVFGDTTITDPSGAAFNVEGLGPDGDIDYNGSIANDNGDLITIRTTTGGSTIDFNTTGINSLTGTGGGGILIVDADGDVNITTRTTIVDPSNSFALAGVSVFGGNGTLSFTDTTIDVPNSLAGVNAAVEISSHNGSVRFTNLDITTNSTGTVGLLSSFSNDLLVSGTSTIDTTGGNGISLRDVNSVTITLDSVSVTNSLGGFGNGSGISLVRVAGGTLDVGTTTVNGAALHGIEVENSFATLTFDSVDIANTAGDGVAVGVALGNPGTVIVNGGTIRNVGGDGVHVAGAADFTIQNVEFVLISGFTANVTGSNVSGTGNTAAVFTCNDGGANTGQILFNAGANTCP